MEPANVMVSCVESFRFRPGLDSSIRDIESKELEMMRAKRQAARLPTRVEPYT